MISIILSASAETTEKALDAGFKRQVVLIRHESCYSTNREQSRIEAEVRQLRPFQFLVSDYLGVKPE